ncbi:unnamed protein product [Camellia sinensis]
MRFTESPVIELPVHDALLSIQQDNGSFHVGNTVWPCSLVLVKFAELWLTPLTTTSNPNPNPNPYAALLDFHLLGLHNVVLTDIAPVMPTLKRNLKSNSDQITALCPPFDLVIATDVVYIEDTAAPLVFAMEASIGDTGTVLLGYQLRSPEAHHLFWEICGRVFDIQKVPHEHLHPEYAYEEADVYILRKKL